jgi:hypothetical protein
MIAAGDSYQAAASRSWQVTRLFVPRIGVPNSGSTSAE